MMNTAHTSYFANNPYLVEHFYSKISSNHNNLIINTYPDFETYFNKIMLKYCSEPFLLINLYFYDIDSIIKDNLIKSSNIINFILDKMISNIRMDIIPIKHFNIYHKMESKAAVIQHCLKGNDLKINKKICEKLIERADYLYKLRNIYIDKSHLNLDEFLNKLFSNIAAYFQMDQGRIIIWTKTNGRRELFEKKLCSHPEPLSKYTYHNEPDTSVGLKIQNVNEIKLRALRSELKSSGIKYHIFTSINSKYTTGYLDFFSKLDKVGSNEHELISFIEKQLTFIIDNTFFFQEMLERKGAEIAVFDNTDDGILVVNKDRVVVDMNESVEKFTGWNRKEAIGAPCRLLYRSCNFSGTSMCNTECPMLSPLLEMRSTTKDLIYTRNKSGAQRIVKSDYFLNKNVQSQTLFAVAVVRDITDRVQLEEKFQHFEQLSTIGKFAAELAHEIRNPITGISCNAQFLYEEGGIAKRHRPIIKEIVQSANSIEQVLKKFLNLAHPPEPSPCKVNLHDLILEAISIFKKKMDKMGIKLEMALHPKIPYVNIDFDLTKQVVINIVMNSLEAMENGGRLMFETRIHQVKASPTGTKDTYVRLKISDNGSGIASEDLERIFDPFFSTKKTGSGLGLYISYKAIKDQNGLMEVRSKKGSGTQTIIDFKLV